MTKKNIRIPVQLNSQANITFGLEQDFESLDVLSMNITSSDAYSKATSDFGVVVGRVVINGGFGVKNAKVSIFVPITAADKLRPEILEIYPFETINDSFPNGVRYNLLPRIKQSNPDHVPVGTFPDITDLTHYPIYVEIIEKYYKYTTVTNEHGDYMIFGVPLGPQNILMDFDLLDTPSLSVGVNDLIMNLPFGKELITTIPEKIEPSRIPGFTYYGGQTYTLNQNTDINSMPNIFSENKSINVIPFWGDKDKTSLGITRCDFGINYNYVPSAVFFGSLLTTKLGYGVITPNYLLTDSKLSDLTAFRNLKVVIWNFINGVQTYYGTFSALDIKQTTSDPNFMGVFRLNLPMYTDYFKMNEFGEIIESTDNTGVPTKGQYIFELYDADEVWNGRLDNQFAYNRGNILPGIRIPANDNGPTIFGGWDITTPITFEYDIQNAKKKYYTISTTYKTTAKRSLIENGNYLPYIPDQTHENSATLTESGFPLNTETAYSFKSNRTVIGSTYVPRIQMQAEVNTIDQTLLNYSTIAENYTVKLAIADNVITYLKSNETQKTQIVQPQEWLLGLNVKANGGMYADAEPMSKYYGEGKIYNFIYNSNSGNTWNYGANSTGNITSQAYYVDLTAKLLDSAQLNDYGVFNMFTSGILGTNIGGNIYLGTTGPFINSSTIIGGVGLFTTDIYDITNDLSELIKDKLNTSMLSETGLYNNKHYYFGKTYDTSSLKAIEEIYNG